MADAPPHDAEFPDDPNSPFLIALWDRLERAVELSTGQDVMDRIAEIRVLCEEAVALLRDGPGGAPPS